MMPQVRIARPVSNLAISRDLYIGGLDLQVLGQFKDHNGFDGVMLGKPGASIHFEFTHCRTHPVTPWPTAEDLIVFFMPDATEWKNACHRMLSAGFKPVGSFNPYWDERGRTFEDIDGYRTVLERGQWMRTLAT